MFSALTMDPVVSALSGLVVAVTLALLYRRSSKSNLPFPPGPKPKFLTGNLDVVPKSYPWLAYTALGKEYGA